MDTTSSLKIDAEEIMLAEDLDLTEKKTVLARPSVCPYCKGEAVIRFDDVNPYVEMIHKPGFLKTCKGAGLTTWHIQDLEINRQIELLNHWIRKERFKIIQEGQWKNEF